MRLSILAGIFIGLTGIVQADSSDPTSPIVTVNGDVITRGDLGMRVLARLISEGKPVESAQESGEISRVAPSVTTELIVEKLLDQAAKKKGVTATEEEIEVDLVSFRESVPEGLTYSEYLLSYGTTEPIIRQDIARNIRVRKLTEQLTSKIEEPDDSILQAAYLKNRDALKADVLQARHIVVKTRAEAEAARARVTGDEPEDFAEVAAEVSTGTTAQRGGALNEFPRGFLDPTFDEAAFALKPGEVSDVVETAAGFHVIKLEGIKKDAPLTFETARSRLRNQIYGLQHNAIMHRLIYELRSAAELEWPEGTAPPPAETGGAEQ